MYDIFRVVFSNALTFSDSLNNKIAPDTTGSFLPYLLTQQVDARDVPPHFMHQS